MIELREAVQPHEREFVPIAALKSDLSVNDMKEAAPAQSFRIPPLEDCPLAVGKEIFANANHFGGVKAGPEHCANSLAAVDGAFGDLMIGRIRMVEGGQRIDLGAVERVDPSRTTSLGDITRIRKAQIAIAKPSDESAECR